MLLDLFVEVAELRVPVRALLALDGLGVALQAEALLAQQVTDGAGAYPVALAGELGGKRAGRLRRPAQRRHRIAPLIRLDQGQQSAPETGIKVGQPLAAAAVGSRPAQRILPRLQLRHPTRHSALPHAGRPRHRPDPAMAERPRVRPRHQPPLPLVQMREQRLELRRQRSR